MYRSITGIIALFSFCLFILPANVDCQEIDNEKLMPDLKISGFIKSDFIYDSRQNFTVRENMLLLYPKPRVDDASGSDINDVRNIQFIPIATRLSASLSGTRILNARATGLVEGEFLGTTDMTSNSFRLRHANILLNWDSGISVLLGQSWHPLFILTCYPTTGSFNSGMPFNPFSRNPLIELTYRTNNMAYSVTATTQLDFRSMGPNGGSAEYLRNSGIPEMTVKLIYTSDNNGFMAGGAASFKQLRPRLTDTEGNKVDELISSASLTAFSKYIKGMTTIKLAGIVGQDMFHLMMLGGYAVRSDNNYGQENLFGQQLHYTPVNTFSTWGEFIYGKLWEFGIFTGFSKNLGAADNIDLGDRSPVFYSRGSDVNMLLRISPRLSYNIKNIRLGAETELTRASYSKTIDHKGRPQGYDPADNLRFLLFAFYNF